MTIQESRLSRIKLLQVYIPVTTTNLKLSFQPEQRQQPFNCNGELLQKHQDSNGPDVSGFDEVWFT